MDVTSIIIGGVGGLVVGLVIGLVMMKNKAAVWEEQLATTREKLEKVKADATKAQEASKAKVKAAQEKLASTNEAAKKLRAAAEAKEKEAAQLRGQAEQIQASLQEVEGARAKAAEMAEAHKKARQQAEGRFKQAEALTAQVQQQVASLEAQLQGVSAEKDGLTKTVERQTKEVQRLRADLSAAGGGGSGLEASMEAFSGSDGTLEGVLNVLLEAEGQTSAVLADANGIVVSAVGDNELKEGIAATAQLVGSIVKQLEGMVPFDQLRSYYIRDDSANVIAGRAFVCAGETVGLVTHGPRIPAERVLDGAMAHLSAILE